MVSIAVKIEDREIDAMINPLLTSTLAFSLQAHSWLEINAVARTSLEKAEARSFMPFWIKLDDRILLTSLNLTVGEHHETRSFCLFGELGARA